MEHEELTRIIIGCAIRVHRAPGPGFLESVYRNALAHELSKACLEVNFGAQRLPFKRKSRVYRPKQDWTG